MCLHAHVEAHEEVGEVHTQAHAVGKCQLLVELTKLKHTAGLIGIVANGPDVASIDKRRALNHPKQFGSELDAGIEANVATLVDETVLRVASGKTTRSEGAHTPTSHAVGTTSVETLFKRHHRGVAIRNGDTCTHMHGKRGAVGEIVRECVVGLHFHILRVSDAKHLVTVFITLALPYQLRNAVEHVAGGFCRGANGVEILLKGFAQWRYFTLVGVVETVAQSHDEVVFVRVAQQRIADAVEEVRLALGQRHIVEVHQVERVVRLVLALAPHIFPSCASNDACVFGARLITERGGQFGGGFNALLETVLQERCLEFWVNDTQLARVFRIIVVD